MAVVFEFEVNKDFHFSTLFAAQFGLEAVDDRVYLPATLGDGFIQEIALSNGLYLCLHNYHLVQELTLRRTDTPGAAMLTIKFDCRRLPLTNDIHQPLFLGGEGCEVEFGTSNHFTELTIPPGKLIKFLVIGITRNALINLLALSDNESSTEEMLRENASFLVHECITREMEGIIKRISQINEKTLLSTLLYQAKTLELIYLLLEKLIVRPAINAVALSQDDAKKVYAVREALMADVTQTPKLSELSKVAGMSATKTKLLFRQVFGDSIYSYYQSAKMNEAAHLLKESTVSETGYKLGFTNLSHFTRLFRKHYEMKPKKFKDSLKLQ